MTDEPPNRWAPLSRGERIALGMALGFIALAMALLLLAVVTAAVPRADLSGVDTVVLAGMFIVVCFAALGIVLVRLWWVRQPKRRGWLGTSWREWRSGRAVGVVLSLFGFALAGFAAVALPFHFDRFYELLWMFVIAGVSTWLGAGFIYGHAYRHASPAAQGLMRLMSYVITAAGVLSALYAGACTYGIVTVASIVEPPQGSPLGVFLLGLTVIIPTAIIAAALLFSGSQMRKQDPGLS